jgi:hypothetical protein
MGMGHRIYRVRDPRAAVLEKAVARLHDAGVRTDRLALARAVEREQPRETTLDMAGPDVTTTTEVIDLLEKLTGKRAIRLPIPEALAKLGTGAAELVGVDVKVTDDQITMLTEGNVIPPGEPNALTDVFGITPTPLREGLRRLADELPDASFSLVPGAGHALPLEAPGAIAAAIASVQPERRTSRRAGSA